ncbi:MAG TPA: biopolymer transporter ExbD [Candidatus Dormibacteraeota bacterium]|nr:biopolymer transporter ExbD [Candidatus Dormibacteraeota bacterium]
MNSHPTNTGMRPELVVLSVVLTFAAVLFPPRSGQAQQLQKGVSVVMAPTTNAVPMPEADDEDAWIVTIVRDGALYFGTDRVTITDLEAAMKSHPRRRDQELYIKADARAPFADVRRVIAAAQDVGFEAGFLLTSQAESVAPGTVLPPKGLEVRVAPHSNAATIVVQVNSGQPPVFQVNDQEIPAAALPGTLRRLLQNRSDTPVLVKTRGPVLFAPVVQAIDECRSIGAKVMIATPEL